MLAFGMILAGLWARRRAARQGIDPSHIDLMLPLALLGGVGGVFLFRWLSGPAIVPMGPGVDVAFRRQFFVFLFLSAPFIVLYARHFGLALGRIADCLGLPMLLGIVCIRMGCFMAGCCWGDVVNRDGVTAEFDPQVLAPLQTAPWLDTYLSPLAVQFPANSYPWLQHQLAGLLAPHAEHSLPVHPTQLYEAVLVAVFLFGLMQIERARRTAGMIGLAALTGYAAIRFIVEFFRADNAPIMGALTSHQLASVILIGLSAAGYIVLSRRTIADERFNNNKRGLAS
jgi:prolipoprotein diacylglyceryltransferase